MTMPVAVLLMFLVTVLPRVLPLLLVRRPLRSPRIRAFLYYVPFAVLSAMILPDIFDSTGSTVTAAAGFAVALLLSLRRRSLVVVAIGGATAVIITDLLLGLF